MRITAEEKNATRQRIVEAALESFRTQGYDATTTRDIARAASIATGTLFNYFDTKEAIVVALVSEALTSAHSSLPGGGETTFEEDLFGLVAAELRRLKPLRKFIAPFLERVMSPLIDVPPGGSPNTRVEHLELVAEIVRRHGQPEISVVALQMYWALYTGVLAFWSADQSTKQEETLALLDESINMFATWLRIAGGEANQEREPR